MYLDNINIESAALSIPEMSFAEIKLIPNPASDLLQIKTDNNLRFDAIELLSIDGKLLQSFSGTTRFVSVKNLTNGLYFIQFKAGKQLLIQKLQVIH